MGEAAYKTAWKAIFGDDADAASFTPQKKAELFRCACLVGYIEKIELFEKDALPLIDKRSIVSEVVKAGRVDVLQHLYLRGWDLRAHDDDALLTAAKFGATAAARFLLSIGADPLVKNDFPLDLAAEAAARDGDNAILSVFLETGVYEQESLIDVAAEMAKKENIPQLEEILKYIDDINALRGRLLGAVAGHDRAAESAINFLIAAGADVHIAHEKPLFFAMRQKIPKNIHAIAVAGGDPMRFSEGVWQEMRDAPDNILNIMKEAMENRRVEAAALFETLTLPQALTETVTPDGMTGWMLAARAGKIDDAVSAVMNQQPEARAKFVSVEAFLDSGTMTVSTLDILVRMDSLLPIFSPDLWRGRSAEAQRLCDLLPESCSKEAQEEIDDLIAQERAEETRRRLHNPDKRNRWRLPPR